MIKLKDILLEIGEASAKPFTFKKISGPSAKEYKGNDSDELLYEFTTDKKTKYFVSIEIDKRSYRSEYPRSIISEINFGVQTVGGGYSLDDTNLGEQYRVMATIKDIVIEFINEWQELWYIHSIEVSPIKSTDGGEDDTIDAVDSRRGKLYLAYMRKALIPNLDKPYEVRVFNDYFLIQPHFANPFE